MRALRSVMAGMGVLTASATVAAVAVAGDATVIEPTAHRAAAAIAPSAAFSAAGGRPAGGFLFVGSGGRSSIGKVAIRLTCQAPDGLPCMVGIGVANGKHTVAQGSKALSGKTKIVLQLSRYARDKLSHHGLKLVTVAVAKDHHGNQAVAGFEGILRQIVVPRPR